MHYHSTVNFSDIHDFLSSVELSLVQNRQLYLNRFLMEITWNYKKYSGGNLLVGNFFPYFLAVIQKNLIIN